VPSEPTATSVAGFLAEVTSTLAQLDQSQLSAIEERLFLAWRERRTVFVMGNGGSASTASHFVSDLAKYSVVEGKPRFRVIGLTDNVPLMSALTNDNGWGSVFSEQLTPWIEPRDVLVGFSVHGGSGLGDAGPWSQNMVVAMQYARASGASVLGFSGYDGGAMNDLAEACAVVPVQEPRIGTPLVEGIHVVLHHLVVHRLRERIERA
jgi:phosphoheptose isomerase